MNNATAPQNACDVLAGTGLKNVPEVFANLKAAELVEQSVRRGEARLSADGALVAHTGEHTGRSVKDKFVVDEPASTDEVWWGDINQKLAPAQFQRLADQVRGYLAGQPLFTQDLYAGADPAHRIRVRLVTTNAWQALFARNMFIRPSDAELEGFEPDWVILHAPGFEVDAATCGVRSSTAVTLSLDQKLVVIAGTQYAGEIKKSIFTVMNWLLPAKGVMPMHCSANVGVDGDVALFFGLSGTGKTTLSSDRARPLIGDDEHGWSDEGVFNFEGGCYAKVIDLNQEAEPDIWAASHRFGVVLENVAIGSGGTLDLTDSSKTENTRSCYPLDFVPNICPGSRAGQPRNVIMLTADAFGVLPPVAKLTPDQAMYHFISGYTARIAGTEKGLGREPQATFSPCFGGPFLPRPPQVYGELLKQRLSSGDVTCWLVNTGWTGGAYGVGKRMSLTHTRAILAAILGGGLTSGEFEAEPLFGLSLPKAVDGVPAEVLDPVRSWSDSAEYERTARHLLALFEKNYTALKAGGAAG
ncbi:phosphoenolpyruvate carboxykinase (ATP) [Acetobacter sp. DsW_063]|uniref:phosphoenolpyruvate carboxykinase (ATP) n=1 Tax=Acetobacter sp. DsW_063 TaxID=1514894 RepID=UPI000A3BD7DF|nr:phosphoenolpyruvate carboxykinase (ATP) [Acetobacter sp. DsW_063]OUJ14502.1 hypothetical protein HK28_13125 [Acetobacter sp. DsW_063]